MTGHSLNCSWTKRLLAYSLTLSLSSLTGCNGQSNEAAFQIYLDRLARTLQVREEPLPTQPPLPRPPRTGQLRIDPFAQNLAALDFLNLSGCELQVTIGKRNSSLGRLATDSQRLLLELEYLRLAPACTALLRERGEAELADQLDSTWSSKREQLGAHVFNATLANREFREFWRSDDPTQDYPAGRTGLAMVDALAAVAKLAQQWLGGNYSVDHDRFEQLLGEISRGDGGTLWLALAIQSSWLNQANTIIDQRRARGPLCASDRHYEAADILPNVVRKFFIQGIQPRAAALGRRYHQLLPPVHRLESLLNDVLPRDYRDWQSHRDASFTRFVAAPKTHVGKLQMILRDCQSLSDFARQ